MCVTIQLPCIHTRNVHVYEGEVCMWLRLWRWGDVYIRRTSLMPSIEITKSKYVSSPARCAGELSSTWRKWGTESQSHGALPILPAPASHLWPIDKSVVLTYLEHVVAFGSPSWYLYWLRAAHLARQRAQAFSFLHVDLVASLWSRAIDTDEPHPLVCRFTCCFLILPTSSLLLLLLS